MRTLAKQISELLFEYDCVIVPGLGGFIALYKPARINPHNHTFYPPSRFISYNSALDQNDGMLINAYALTNSMSFSQAKASIDKIVHSIRIQMLKGITIDLEGIGSLYTNKENNIEFIPDGKINYLADSFGLPRFTFNPVNRNTATSKYLSRSDVRKTMRWAAIITPLTALALWTSFHPEALNKIYNNYASIIPSAREESLTESKIGNTIKNGRSPSESSKTYIYETPITSINKCISVSESYKFSQPEALSTTGESKIIKTEANIKRVMPEINQVDKSGAIHTSTIYHIIAGAFSLEENALNLVNELNSKGFDAELLGQNRRKLHLVSLEKYTNKSDADQQLQLIQKQGFPSAWILKKAN